MMDQATARLDIRLCTPLGDDKFRVKSASVFSEISRCFEIDLELVSEDANVIFEDLIGQSVTVELSRPGGAPYLFNGHIESLYYTGQGRDGSNYQAKLVPWLWMLTQSSDCRIFQNQSVPEIVKTVFSEKGFDDFEDHLFGEYSPRTFCVQYRESDFDFVSRLLESEGIFFHFRHEQGRHVLVLGDHSVTTDRFEGSGQIAFRDSDQATPYSESIWTLVPGKKLRSGSYVLNDFNEERPRDYLMTRSSIIREHAVADYEQYDYPGNYEKFGEGERYARLRIEEIAASYELLTGRTDSQGIRSGYSFELVHHPREDLNRDYLITSTRITARDSRFGLETETLAAPGESRADPPADPSAESYVCDFTAIDLRTAYRPPRRTASPCITGPQTATVVGPPGQEIWTDKNGRIKVQFHWDREGQSNENSSCWIRVTQASAGRGWGTTFIPRIGQEVVVEFLEGDPDRPLVTGAVYNGVSTPPYDLRANNTVSTIKTNSSKGGEGFNEIRFEDLKGKEEVFIHAERDHNIVIGHDKTQRVANDEYGDVQNNKNQYVKNDRTTQIDGNDNLYAKKDIRIIGDRNLTIVAANEIKIQTGESTLFMKKDGTIIISGKNVVLNASQQFAYTSDTIVGEAGTHHHFKGATVKHNA